MRIFDSEMEDLMAAIISFGFLGVMTLVLGALTLREGRMKKGGR
jgi:hypothetical protein